MKVPKDDSKEQNFLNRKVLGVTASILLVIFIICWILWFEPKLSAPSHTAIINKDVPSAIDSRPSNPAENPRNPDDSVDVVSSPASDSTLQPIQITVPMPLKKTDSALAPIQIDMPRESRHLVSRTPSVPIPSVKVQIPSEGKNESQLISVSPGGNNSSIPNDAATKPKLVASLPENIASMSPIGDSSVDPMQITSAPVVAEHRALGALSELSVDSDNASRAAPTFVRAMALGSNDDIWIGTEDDGLFLYQPNTGVFQQFTKKDGLGDNNAYSIAVDHQNRVWIGHQNHGVSVYNGQRWQNYDVYSDDGQSHALVGPMGERIFKIAVCPTDGDVWIATSAGLTRYSVSKDTWTHFTCASGLPSDQVQVLAFDFDGNLYAGTQCDGLAIAQAADGYHVWRQVKGPDQLPTDPAGNGLPNSLINDLLVSRDGTIYAATTAGLAESHDHGKSWRYSRGKDWADKIRGLTAGPPKDWTYKPGAWLTEDYITCLAEDDDGNLWVGYWRKGWEEFQKGTHTSLAISTNEQKPYVNAILPRPDGSVWAGCYPEGVLQIRNVNKVKQTNAITVSRPQAAALPPLPSGAAPPNLDELNGMLAELANVKLTDSANQPSVVAIDDDWRTQGTWIGRYGKYWACLCAMCSPQDYIWGSGSEPVVYKAAIGPHQRPQGDRVRYWIEFNYGGSSRSLEIPSVYLDSRVVKGYTKPQSNRREATWDDHGEAYPLTMEGPDLYCSLKIPNGLFYLSLYEMNKDGHGGTARQRDDRISVRECDPNRAFGDIENFASQPELAHARIRDFWGGVYKRFWVRGPIALTVQVRRDYSGDTIINGVMLDSVNEKPEPYFPVDEGQIAQNKDASQTENTQQATANRLFDKLNEIQLRNPSWFASESRRFYQPLLRWYSSDSVDLTDENLSRLATCYYQMQLYEKWEQCLKEEQIATPRQIEKSLRWDRVSDYSGRGRQTVQAFLRDHPLSDITN